jgi:hypothetical protein
MHYFKLYKTSTESVQLMKNSTKSLSIINSKNCLYLVKVEIFNQI